MWRASSAQTTALKASVTTWVLKPSTSTWISSGVRKRSICASGGAADRYTATSSPTFQPPPAVDTYDCVIIDECHRGYGLDREMSEAELGFRSEADYISTYRRVLDHFDATRIGLTATPALHTTEIFRLPVCQYSYRQAVIDGHLVDHRPPIRIVTELARRGITCGGHPRNPCSGGPRSGEVGQRGSRA